MNKAARAAMPDTAVNDRSLSVEPIVESGLRERSDAERRGAFLAAGAVVILFGVVLLAWALLFHATAAETRAPSNVEAQR